MPFAQWAQRFGAVHHAICTDILPRFSPAVIAEATRRANELEVYVRPEDLET
jgi:hypothetical protein